MSISINDSRLIKEYYALNKLEEIIPKLNNVTLRQAFYHVKYKSYKIDLGKHKERGRIILFRNIEKEAMIIQSFVCNPDRRLKDIAKDFNLTEGHISRICDRYFAYKGYDKITITLKSRV